MKTAKKIFSFLLALCLFAGASAPSVHALTFTDAHGNVIELDESLEAYSEVTLLGADNAARMGETNLGDLWADALRWFAASGGIDAYFEEDDVTAGNNTVAVDDDHIVALWNGGNLRDDIEAGSFGAEALANVLPYPNKVAVVYMTGAQLLEALEAASQGLPYVGATADACASFMQVSGLRYTVDAYKAYDRGEAYGSRWFRANSVNRVTITEVNGQAFDASAVYAVITSNANYNGMDSSYIFKEAAAENEKSTITTAVVRDVVWMYISQELGGVVGSTYAEPQGRISIERSIFTDTVENSWYMDSVYYATSHGLMNGTSTTTFEPLSAMTRAMVVTTLYRIAGSPEVETSESGWYAAARQWAMEQGISDGTDMTGLITREQLVTMLYRYTENAEATGDLSVFSDNDKVSDWAADAMKWAVGTGIIEGNNGALDPAGSALRSEVATILMRYCSK